MLLPPERPLELLPARRPQEIHRSRDIEKPRPPRNLPTAIALLGAPLLLWALQGGSPAERPPAGATRTAAILALPRAADAFVLADDESATPLPESPTLPPRVETTLRPGETLAAALERLRLEGAEGRRLIGALAERLDLRRLPAASGLVLLRDERGEVRSLAVRSESDRFVRVSAARAGRAPVVEVVALEGSTLVETAGGTVSQSLNQALAGHRHGGELGLAFADLFQWDFDPLSDPRPGDQVRLVFEVRRLVDVPDDLPAFRDAARRAGDELGVGRILAAAYAGERARASAFWVEDGRGSGRYFDERGEALQKTFLKSPLNYRRISSRFSNARRHPVTRKVVPHHGVDFAAPTGTPVVAAADGRVTRAGWKGALGLSIRLGHGGGYETVYGHLSRLGSGVRPGASVQQGQVIGYVGATGRATGPHLHYTLIERGRPIDPLALKHAQPAPPDESMLVRLAHSKATWAPLLGSIPTPAELAASAPASARSDDA